MKNRNDLIREFRKDRGYSADPETLQMIERVDYPGWIEQDFEEAFAPELNKEENQEFLSSDIGLQIAKEWDERSQKIESALSDIEGVNDMLDELPGIIEYIEWLENKLCE